MRLCVGVVSALLMALGGVAGVFLLCVILAHYLMWIPWDIKFFFVCFALCAVVALVYLVLRRAVGTQE